MNGFFKTWAVALYSPVAMAQVVSAGTCIIGIDHIPVAVSDLERAEDAYRRMGFSLKPGRFHADGIRNAHIKFPDGSGVELITASEPKDDLARSYVESLKQGDGPTSFALHARDTTKLVAALKTAGYDFEQEEGIISLKDPQLRSVFFVQDNRSPTDRPEHFAHPNSAVAMTGIWLAPDDSSGLNKLLLALGATSSRQTVLVPAPVECTVYAVENGQIVVLPKEGRIRPGRPVVGAVFSTRDLAAVRACLNSAGAAPIASPALSGEGRLFVAPEFGRGIWLEFHSVGLGSDATAKPNQAIQRTADRP